MDMSCSYYSWSFFLCPSKPDILFIFVSDQGLFSWRSEVRWSIAFLFLIFILNIFGNYIDSIIYIMYPSFIFVKCAEREEERQIMIAKKHNYVLDSNFKGKSSDPDHLKKE